MLFSIVDTPRFLLWNILTRSYAFASKLSIRYVSDLEVVLIFSRKYFLFLSIKSSYANVLVLSDPKERETVLWAGTNKAESVDNNFLYFPYLNLPDIG